MTDLTGNYSSYKHKYYVAYFYNKTCLYNHSFSIFLVRFFLCFEGECQCWQLMNAKNIIYHERRMDSKQKKVGKIICNIFLYKVLYCFHQFLWFPGVDTFVTLSNLLAGISNEQCQQWMANKTSMAMVVQNSVF